MRLGVLSRRYPELAPYLTREMAVRARDFMKGIALYREHPVQRGAETTPVLWRKGTTCLRDYAPQNLDAPTILVIPALINRFTILDLQQEHSFVRTLVAQGFRVLVVDWDVPGDEEKNFTLDDYVLQRLRPILNLAAVRNPVHILGYCMGGVLALALAAICPEQARSLTLLAAPWDFHAGFAATGQDGRNLERILTPWLSGADCVSDEAVQYLFTALQPLHAFRKFSSFAAQDQASVDAARFVLAEDWLNDGIPLAAPVARECFGDWCGRNVLARGEWRIGGKVIDPHTVVLPSYVVVPGLDRIVPPESSMPLARALPHAVRHEPMMGHIGIMSSPKALHQVWEPLAAWLKAH